MMFVVGFEKKKSKRKEERKRKEEMGQGHTHTHGEKKECRDAGKGLCTGFYFLVYLAFSSV